MQLEILTKKQMKEEIKKEFDKREKLIFEQMDKLRKKIMMLEEELRVYRAERRLKKDKK